MHIALYHNLTSGGSKREAYEFTRQFVRHGHEVVLYHPSSADERFLPLSDVITESFTVPLHLIGNVPGRLPFLRHYLNLGILLLNVRRLRQLGREIAAAIDSARYDFVFVHHDLLVQSPYLLRYLTTRSIYYCAEPMREFYEPSIARPYDQPRTFADHLQRRWYAPMRALRKLIVQQADRTNVRCASQRLTNSAFSAESIYRAYGLRAQISYLGVDTEKFRPLELAREHFVLSVGAVSPLKGYDFLIESLGCLPPAERPSFVIVGNTASTAETWFLLSLAEERGVKLEFLVNIADDELVRLYNRASAFVYSPILEPFGFAPLEAMACETPVVAVKEGGLRESVRDGETGLLVQRDSRVFSEALQRVLDDLQFAQSLGANGREAVLQLWTWEHAYERLMENVSAGPSQGNN